MRRFPMFFFLLCVLFDLVFIRRIIIFMYYCSYASKFMFHICVCDSVHVADEAIHCGVLMFLWITRAVIVYDQSCRCRVSKHFWMSVCFVNL
jgi:hypothetical protein